MISRMLKVKGVFISWIVSYIAILFIPILVSVVVYLESVKVIEGEINKANSALLNQVQQDMDSKLQKIDRLYKEIVLNEKIRGLIYASYPLESLYQFNISQLITKELAAYSTVSELLDSYYIFFKRGNFALVPGAKYDSEIVFDIFHKNSSLTYEKWYELQERYNYKDTISVASDNTDSSNGRSIFALYSLPIEYIEPETVLAKGYVKPEATLVVRIDKKQIKELNESTQWISQGKFMILDRNNNIIVSNIEDKTLKQIEYNKLENSNSPVYEKIEQEKMVISFIKSKVMDWKYVSIIPERVFWEKASYIRNITLYGLLFCILAGGVIAYFFARTNYSPVSELIKVFKGESKLMSVSASNEYQFIKDAINNTIAEKEKINKKLELQKDIMFSNLVTKLLRGRIGSHEHLIDMLSSNDIEFISDEFAVILFNIDDYGEIFEDANKCDEISKLQLVQFAFRNIMERSDEQKLRGYIVEIDEMVACLINFIEIGCPDHVVNMEKIAGEVIKFIKDNFSIHSTAAISNIHNAYYGIFQAHQEAIEAMEYRIIVGTGEVIKYSEIRSTQRKYIYPLEKEIQLINQIKGGNFLKANEILDDIFNINFRDGIISVEIAKCLMFDLASTIIKAIDEIEDYLGNKGDLWNIINPVKTLISCETVIDMRIELERVLRYVCFNIAGHS